MFLFKILRKGGEWVGSQRLLANAGAALHASVLAHLAQARVGQVPHWAGAHLARAADWALGGIALHHCTDERIALDVVHAHTRHAGGVLAAGGASILALLAHQLGADRAGDDHIRVHVLDVDGGSLGVLIVLGLWRVLDALVGLHDELSLGSLHDDPTLHVHEGGGLGGACWDLASLAADALAVCTLNWTVHFVLYLNIILQLGNSAGQQSQTAGAALHTLVLALLAQARVGQVPRWAGAHLAWAAAGLGCAVQTGQTHTLDVGTGDVAVGAHLAGGLGADGGGHACTRGGQGAHGATWALDVGRLGVVGGALVSLDDVLALRCHHDDAVLLIHKLGGGLGDSWTTASHGWYYYTIKKFSPSTCSHS